MPLQVLQFSFEINSSVNVGDHVFYIPGMVNSSQGSLPSNYFDEGYLNNAYYFGKIYSISNQDAVNGTPSITVDVFTDSNNVQVVSNPAAGDWVFYLKDTVVDQDDLKGYYASVKLKNNSKDKAELFALSANIEESSK